MSGIIFASGCDSTPEAESKNKSSKSSQARENLERRRLCKEQFNKVYSILTPSSANLNSDALSALSVLNQWMTSCAEEPGQPIPAGASWLPEDISPDLIERLNKPTASQRDILYLRDNLLMRRIVEQVIASLPTDVEKVRALHDYTCRNIVTTVPLIDPRLGGLSGLDAQTLNSKDPLAIPRTLQEIALTGTGASDDRIWMFTALLKQLSLGSLVIAPQSNELPTIVIVPLEDEFAAFVPGLGVELPASASEPQDLWPVSALKQGIGNLFANLLPEGKMAGTPLASFAKADWSSSNSYLPYSLLSVAPRMQALQLEFAGENVCEVYQPLTYGEISLPPEINLAQLESETNAVAEKGIISNALLNQLLPLLRQLSQKPPKFWPRIESSYDKVMSLSNQQSVMRNLNQATLLKEVQTIRTNQDENDNRTVSASGEKQLLKGRLDQLLGNRQEAIVRYMRIRLQFGVAGVDQTVQVENLLRGLQIEDAQYWSALAQYENGDVGGAVETLRNYLNRYTQGRWPLPATKLLALALAEQGKMDEARTALESDSLSSDIQSQLLLNKWQSQQD